MPAMSSQIRFLVPTPATEGLRFGQGRILSWDPETFENIVEWRGIQLTNLRVLSGVDALGFQVGDNVGLLGWAPEGGASTWFIAGRISIPGQDSPDLVVRGSNLVIEGGRFVSIDPEQNRQVVIDDGTIFFGTAAPDSLTAEINAVNQDIQILADANASVVAANELALAASTGGIFILTEPGSSTDVTIDPDDDCFVTPGDQFSVDAGGQIVLDSAANQVFITYGTTGSAANAVIAGAAPGPSVIQQSTSSARYKDDITDFHTNPATVLDLKPRTWRDKAEKAAHPEIERWHVGFVAEEVDALGLSAFVDYDDQGRPEAITYDRLCVGLLEVVKFQQAQIDWLIDKIAIEGDQLPKPPKYDILPKRAPLPRQHPGKADKIRSQPHLKFRNRSGESSTPA